MIYRSRRNRSPHRAAFFSSVLRRYLRFMNTSRVNDEVDVV